MTRQVLVTGASKGIGRAIALKLAEDGFTISVHYMGDKKGALQTVSEINELEYYDGRIYANVWREDVILQIQPATGRVTGKIDMSGLLDEIIADDGACLNGIAVNKETNTFYVTGKLWPKMFEVKFVEKPPEKNE